MTSSCSIIKWLLLLLIEGALHHYRGTLRLNTAFAAPHSWLSCEYSNETLSFQNHLPYRKAVRQKAASTAASHLHLSSLFLQVKLLHMDEGQGHQWFVTQ